MSILDDIVEYKRRYLAERKARIPQQHWEREAQSAAHRRVPLDFASALRRPGPAAGIRIIAEVKRASPSAGDIAPAADPSVQARRYTAAGAHAVSVLTDRKYFRGSEDDLASVREAVGSTPVLRKEFIIDAYQIYEARALGADAVLLIAAILKREELAGLLELTHELGMEALVEIYDEQELERIEGLSVRILGVNNRDLRTFQVALEHTGRVLSLIPPMRREEMVLVSESGVRSAADARFLRRQGADAILVGEALMRAADPAALIREFTAPDSAYPPAGAAGPV
ncbi:MAG: indole-3-glycerol phosphate synthase TrpC [Candidatus Sumerlaeia bacterium]